jgi:hypothetical protein
MTDDAERRLRDALHRVDLPAAPASLRESVRAVAAQPSPRRLPSPRWWSPSRWAAPVAAVAVVAIAVAVVATGLLRLDRSSSATPAPPSATAVPTPAVPPMTVEVLDATHLGAAIRDVRGGAAAAHDVIADVGVDPGTTPAPATRECAEPLGTCTVVGVLDGFDAVVGVVTVRSQDGVLPPPTSPADLQGPLALRLVPGGPIAGSLSALDVPALSAATATAAAGHVVAVRAWLEGVSVPSCGPAQPADVPYPFSCEGERSFLSPDAVKPATGTAISAVVNVPASAVRVQAFAYDAFAPRPVYDGLNNEPRLGLYLVRMVAVDNADCPACRGWLVAGRLDAASTSTASGSPPPNAGVRVYSAAELATALADDRSSLLGKAVIVDGRVVPGTAGPCASPAPGSNDGATCPLGTLDGTEERVVASPFTASLLLPDTDYPVNNVMAMTVRDDGLEYLGWMGYVNGTSFNATLADLADPRSQARGPETVIVSAWLVANPPIPCPAPLDPMPAADTPFQACPGAWLTPTAEVPWTSNSVDTNGPADGVRVQWGAYADFAPGAVSTSGEPKYGTYLVRLVTNTAIGPDGPRGWQVVGRLSP